MHFVSLFFINERNIATSLLMIHLKCIIVYYANLNWSSINKPYLRTVEYAILFFSISCLYLKTFEFWKHFIEKLSFFNINFKNLFQDVLCYRILLQNIRISNLVIVKWRPFEYKSKFEKKTYFLGPKQIPLRYFLKNCRKKVLKIYKSIIIENFKPVPLSPIKW